MRLKKPRIAPLQDDQLTEEQVAALAPVIENGPNLNIWRTFAHSPKALERFLKWGAYVLSRRNTLPVRERELLILRVGYLCRAGYEFTQHTEIGLESGLTMDEVNRVKGGPDAGWSEAEAALLRAADELVGDHFISDATWAGLTTHFSERQVMDAVFTVGQYTQLGMFLNTFGVQLEEGQVLDPELRA